MSKMLCVALVALCAMSVSARQLHSRQLTQAVVHTSGVSVQINKVSGPNDFDAAWLAENNTVCVGQIIYNVTNVGDSTINPYIYGPLTVTAPASSNAVLADPTSYLYNTTAAAGTRLASGVEIFNVGYYAGPSGWTMFALTVACSIPQAAADATTCSCPAGSLPNSIVARTNTTSGQDSDRCRAPYTLTSAGCVKISRANAENADNFDNQWSYGEEGAVKCYGQTLYNIENGGLKPLVAGYEGRISVRLTGAKVYEPNSYNHVSDAEVDATTFTITQAGWYTAPGATSQFALTTYCEGACPCRGFGSSAVTVA